MAPGGIHGLRSGFTPCEDDDIAARAAALTSGRMLSPGRLLEIGLNVVAAAPVAAVVGTVNVGPGHQTLDASVPSRCGPTLKVSTFPHRKGGHAPREQPTTRAVGSGETSGAAPACVWACAGVLRMPRPDDGNGCGGHREAVAPYLAHTKTGAPREDALRAVGPRRQ